MIFKLKISLLVLFWFLFSQSDSGSEYRRYGVHNGNLVKTVFGNWGVVGQPGNNGPRGAWINENNGYIGDVSLLVGVETQALNESGVLTPFHSVVVCPVDRPTLGPKEQSSTGTPWGFEPVSGYMNESQDFIAMSTNPSSWPSSWPDKDLDWDGKWNGYFGQDVQSIPQESFYVMNDNNDEEFNYSGNNQWGVSFKPNSNNLSMNGLGLEVKVRGMQWSQFQAQDVIFWLYEITNNSDTDYSKVVFGELVGTYVGVTGQDDSAQEYSDDWSFFDVNQDITYTGDFDNNCSGNPNWIGDVGMVGYAFLESPGNPYDGIDNDGDASSYGAGPTFEESDFDVTLVESGMSIVTIDSNYNRQVSVINESNGELITVTSQGNEIEIIIGQTELSEGNLIIEENGEISVNSNAYDGIDNDLDGLIDENYYLHYRQRKEDQNGNVLFDIINPRLYINYISGFGSDNPMIDEKRNDNIDNDGDWDSNYHDVGQDGVAATGDIGENDGTPTLGEPNFDSTDPDESDQLGLTSFDYFSPANTFPHNDDEALWNRLAPGFFDVPSSISNGVPINGEDGDFIFSSGYFPLKAGETERFSIALLYGENQQDLIKNKETVQLIYDQDYRLAPPPSKPTLHAVAGDEKVTLYWDRIAEQEEDPILKEYDFQGYKIYRATDPNFNDVRNITNAHGVIEGYSPLAQFDLKDDIHGYFYPSQDLFEDSQGYTFYMGDSTGLVHEYIDTDVQNGRTYYYAVTAYDNGDPTSMFPSENSKLISILNSGDILLDQNTAYATPSSNSAGYDLNQNFDIEHYGHGTGSISINIIDETELSDNEYEITFLDAFSDGIDNDFDQLIDSLDEDEYIPSTTYYSVLNLKEIREDISLISDQEYSFEYHNISESDFTLEDENGNEISIDLYDVDFNNGKISFSDEAISPPSDFIAKYKYYPIYQSPYIEDSPWILESNDTEVFDGVRILFDNDWNVQITDSFSGVSDIANTDISVTDIPDCCATDDQECCIKSKPYPAEYIISFDEGSYPILRGSLPDAIEDTQMTNFKIYDTQNDRLVPYIFLEQEGFENHTLDFGDQIYFYDKLNDSTYQLSWTLSFFDIGFTYELEDILSISTSKPFNSNDIFYFETSEPFVNDDLASSELSDIRVVPNPYIAATKFESPLPPGVTSGRGERKIEFQNLPHNASVKIFTSRGQHIETLYHNGNIHSGTISWDLKTKENLDIAYGVYFYVVESDVGSKKGKIAIIK